MFYKLRRLRCNLITAVWQRTVVARGRELTAQQEEFHQRQNEVIDEQSQYKRVIDEQSRRFVIVFMASSQHYLPIV